MKNKSDKIIWTVFVGGMYGYSFLNCDISSFCSGVLVGVATIIVAAVWHEP